jgi:prevent-host-death family protein
MKTSVVTIHEAKTHLSRLLKKAANGEEVIIARGATPIARLVPIGAAGGRRRPGLMKGLLSVGPEFFEPLPDDELAGWE